MPLGIHRSDHTTHPFPTQSTAFRERPGAAIHARGKLAAPIEYDERKRTTPPREIADPPISVGGIVSSAIRIAR
jgi:hypothetical protein